MSVFEPLSFLGERLADLLKHEAEILAADETKLIQGLEMDLKVIESYVEDMDAVQRHQKLSLAFARTLSMLMPIVNEIEDFLDQLIDQKWQAEQPARKKRRLEKLQSFWKSESNPLIQKHGVVQKVAEIKRCLVETPELPDRFHLATNSSLVTDRRARPRTTHVIAEGRIVIGLEEDVNNLVPKFLGERRANYAIIGMGGSGKTTLAQLFFNHEAIEKAFPGPRRAWVCVSREWNAHDLLLQICQKLKLDLPENEKQIPGDHLLEFLKKNNCLIVLDDVWEKAALRELLPTLTSARILVTTRNAKVLESPASLAFQPYKARHLTQEESWELFEKTINNCCQGRVDFMGDPRFKLLGKEMLLKCDGLPLAIIALAGLLGKKHTVLQWESIKGDVSSRMRRDDNNDSHDYEAVNTVLDLSYIDLPYYLKSCFLHLGTFKEDDEIDACELIELWVDEGFIKLRGGCCEISKLQEAAKDYLEELVERCMVKVIKESGFGEIETIHIHDLLRDLCIQKAEELHSFQVLTPSTTLQSSHYRAIIYNRKNLALDNSRLRTLIYCNNHLDISCSTISSLEMLKQLRVLKLEKVDLGDSAKHIGNMVLLRHLKLEDCVYKFADAGFMKKLRNLQTLIVKGSKSSDNFRRLNLPSDTFGSMEQLSCLRLDFEEQIDASRKLGIAKLKKLLTLAIPCNGLSVEELKKAIRINCLRELCIRGISDLTLWKAIPDCVKDASTHIRTLTLAVAEDSPNLPCDWEHMNLAMCQRLESLWLIGKIILPQLEPAILFPQTLLKLTLAESWLEEEKDMERVLAGLPLLRVLCLALNAFAGNKLTISGLPQLQKLSLYYLTNLRECNLAQDSFPRLRYVILGGCRRLKMIPNGIGNIHTLQYLGVMLMPERFCRRLKKREDAGTSDGGEDFHLVQHIPTISIEDEEEDEDEDED